MLTLTRKVLERIRIGPDIVVTVVEIGRGWVRIGIEAPPDVEIYREDLVTPETDMSVGPATTATARQMVCGICGNASCDNPSGKH